MCLDNDIKIVGDKPSEDVRRNRMRSAEDSVLDSESIKKAKAIGRKAAQRFIEAAVAPDDENDRDYSLLIQRRLLLSFTVTVGFEKYIKNDSLSGIAQKAFLDAVKKHSPELYDTSSDTGAFSFYYLAYRRGSDTERRIGQTFAMLCSRDGDPIFQELGEALYCWFSSEIKKIIE